MRRDWRTWLLALVGLLLLAGLARECVPGLFGTGLPSDVIASIQRRYTVCVNDIPIWPGDPRQPECGQVTVQVVGKGSVPPSDSARGVTRAVCYTVTYTTPYWTTQGTTRHEIKESSRVASKVAILEAGTWRIFPDEDAQDQQRWSEYACPGAYVTGSIR